MPLPTVITSVLAAVAGALLGWWPLAAWTRHVSNGDRMPLSRLRIAAAVLTAVMFGALALRFGPTPILAALLALAAASTVLALVDLAEKRLPNAVLFPVLGVIAVLLVPASWAAGTWWPLAWAALGALAMFAIYLLLALVSPSSMGMGDVKLALVIGLLAGWFGFDAWLIALFAAFAVGGLAALVALALRRATLRSSIPFGPSMLAGALLAALLVGT